MLTLCSLSATSLSFFSKMSQQEFITGNICFIFSALNAGVRVLLIRFHLSPCALVSMLANGSGGLRINYNNKYVHVTSNGIWLSKIRFHRPFPSLRVKPFMWKCVLPTGSFSCKSNSFSCPRFYTRTRFQTEAQGKARKLPISQPWRRDLKGLEF